MTATYYRSVSPGGGRGVACLTMQEARRDVVERSVAKRCHGPLLPLDEVQYGVLWRGLEGQGWRVEAVSPTGSLAR